MRVEDLISNIGNGIAKSNRYAVFIPDPGGESRRLNILCDSVSLPGRQITTSDRFTSLKPIKMAYSYANEDVNISFVAPADYDPLLVLYIWQNQTMSNMGDGGEGDQRVRYKEDYVRDVEIHSLNSDGYSLWGVKLKNAFPTSVQSIELGNANEDVVRIQATFSYDDWDRLPPGTVTIN